MEEFDNFVIFAKKSFQRNITKFFCTKRKKNEREKIIIKQKRKNNKKRREKMISNA